MDESFSKEERNWATFCHLAAFAVFPTPYIGGLLGPFVIWLLKREEFPLVDDQGKESLNFQLTLFLCFALIALSGFSMAFMGGLLGSFRHSGPPVLFFVVWFGMFAILGLLAILDIISIIVAAVAANKGVRYRYPIAIRFIK